MLIEVNKIQYSKVLLENTTQYILEHYCSLHVTSPHSIAQSTYSTVIVQCTLLYSIQYSTVYSKKYTVKSIQYTALCVPCQSSTYQIWPNSTLPNLTLHYPVPTWPVPFRSVPSFSFQHILAMIFILLFYHFIVFYYLLLFIIFSSCRFIFVFVLFSHVVQYFPRSVHIIKRLEVK